LEEVQQSLFQRAVSFRDESTVRVDTWDEFRQKLEDPGGFLLAHWDGTSETEEAIQNETKATIRCIPMDGEVEAGSCVYSGKPSDRRVVFAKAY